MRQGRYHRKVIGGAVQLQRDDSVDLVPPFLRHRHGQALFVLADRRLPAGEGRSGHHAPPWRRQLKLVSLPFQHVQVDRVPLPSGYAPLGRLVRPAGRPVDRLAVLRQPRAHFTVSLRLARIDPPIRHRAGIEGQVPPTARAADQQVQALLQRLHRLIRAEPRPAGVHRDAALPRAVDLEAPDPLLGCIEVARQAGPVVDDRSRLKRVDHPEQPRAVPILCRAAEPVEPDAIDPPVVRAQLADLAVEVLDVLRVPLGPVVRVVPVGLGVVPEDADAGFAKRLGELRGHIAAEGRVRYLVVGKLAIEHAEAIVVLGEEDGVPPPRRLHEIRPLPGIELRRVELLVEVVVDPKRHAAGRRLQARARSMSGPPDLTLGEAAGPPADEDPELGFPEPLHARRVIVRRLAGDAAADRGGVRT